MNHINPKISDYLLELLPRQERQEVEQHVAGCADCAAALASQQLIGRLVRQTVHEATQPNNGNLRQLMPAIPTKQPRRWSWALSWQRQLASVGVLLMLLFGGMSWYESNHSHSMGPLPTFVAITATYTNEPTTTTTVSSIEATAVPVETVVSANPEPNYSPTPPPNPTPIAALSTFSN